MYAIAGITGKVGSAAAETLLGEEQAVRGLVRSEAKGQKWRERGVELAVGDLADAAFLTRALTGVEGALLLLPPDYPGEVYERQKLLAKVMGQAVRGSKVPHVVLLSSMGAQVPSGTGVVEGLYHAEQALAATGANLTFIRATSFMENLANALPAASQLGVLTSFFDEKTPQPMVATHDIGHLAARSLLAPPTGKKIWELVGPKEYRLAEVAETVARALGKPVKPMALPVESARQNLIKWGVPEFMAAALAEMYQAAATGKLAYDGAGERVRGMTSLWHVVHQLARRAN